MSEIFPDCWQNDQNINERIDVKDISNRLGHSNIKTTLDIYTHLTEDKKKDVTDKFSKFMSM